MLCLSESNIYIFNHSTVAILRLTNLTEAINEKVKIGCTGIAFTCLQAAAALCLGSMQLSSDQYELKTSTII